MGKFNFIETRIPDLFVVEPATFGDSRGFFMESYNSKDFIEAGLNMKFVQDNHSKSAKGVLRGLHFQKKHPQGKLVRVIMGSVYDVAVDLRKNSPTFGLYYGIILSETNKKMLYVPEGFAHGFLTLEDGTEFLYKVTDHWYQEDEGGLIWNDNDIGIAWPFEKYGINRDGLLLSEKDREWTTLRELDFYFSC
ncbi:MAG: dTDP-4-dehydrorhamnose 3,5-epimerase [Maledivibacter sp.]|jgi:dTDP-4-dehydrorhamnose 3,5-epimerase|nr:dTDP-4-dehydrorhamnose 3,5-epimerase [Maledivibacter sp.]